MPVYTIDDPITGEVTYRYETIESEVSRIITTATDYDTEQAQPWQSYTVNYRVQPFGSTVLENATAMFDDGSSFTLENLFVSGVGNVARDYGDRTISRDVLGRADYVYEVFAFEPVLGAPTGIASRAIDYNPDTGLVDYLITTYRDGRVLSEDFDPVTGKLDYKVMADGTGAHIDTDYDLTDAYPWSTYTVSYGADGRVLDVIVG